MAELIQYPDHEEFYALFIRIEGTRGTALLFAESDRSDTETITIANEIGKILDA